MEDIEFEQKESFKHYNLDEFEAELKKTINGE